MRKAGTQEVVQKINEITRGSPLSLLYPLENKSYQIEQSTTDDVIRKIREAVRRKVTGDPSANIDSLQNELAKLDEEISKITKETEDLKSKAEEATKLYNETLSQRQQLEQTLTHRETKFISHCAKEQNAQTVSRAFIEELQIRENVQIPDTTDLANYDPQTACIQVETAINK